jgi:hypothetical protein
MANICGGNDHCVLFLLCQQCCLGSEYHIGIKRKVGSGWAPMSSRIRPELSGEEHCIGCYWQIARCPLELIQMRDTLSAPGAQEFSAHLIVGNFRNYHTHAPSQKFYKPLLASQALRRRAWIRHEAERPGIQHHDHRHIIMVLREQFAGGRAIFIERTDEHLERLALLLRVFALPCVKERDQRLVLFDLRKTPLFWRLIADVI